MLLTCLYIVLGTLVFFYLQVTAAKLSAKDILKPYSHGDELIKKDLSQVKASVEFMEEQQLNTLTTQYEVIESKKEHHMKVAKLMNAYYFASTLTLTILTIALGLQILMMAEDGIKDQTETFQAIFYSLLCLTAFFGILIKVLDHKGNIATNLKSYLAFSSIQLRIYNYLVTGGMVEGKTEVISPGQFISATNTEIDRVNNITFGIKHENIKSANEILNYGN